MLSNIFFDLDGTLTDSKEGIVNCIYYALEKLGYPVPEAFNVNDCLGPPLRLSFRRLLKTNDEALIERAVEIYRERFSTIGLFENRVYPGIPELLSALRENDFKLYVVTTKPRVFAERIIEHFQLAQRFVAIYGTELNGQFDNKADLIEFILKARQLRAEETVMVGDKREDITAGQANRTGTIGVTYGYGTRREITEAAPDDICGSPEEIGQIIMGGIIQ
ncbi:MAG: HAD hydrolase-like protein [Dehalococcoidales bacterium]|jgi:phosphoglycolate phosphatase